MITDIVFILTTVLAVWMFFRASGNKGMVLIFLLVLAIVEGILAKTGFFLNTKSTPPNIMFIGMGILFTTLLLFILPAGRRFLDGLQLKTITTLHVVRIPVELVLYMLFLNQSVPELMTFAGSNPDILSGITAPLVILLFFRKNKINRVGLLLWNLACLALLVNIVARAILSVPTNFQQFGLEQPNVAILYYPYIWLPGIVVPLVLISHLAAIRQLILTKNI